MNFICTFILSHYATGQTLRRISRGVLVDYCAENAIEPIGYNQVKMWLTLSRYEEEYKEFRKEYALVQKRLLPILLDELREDAEELRFHSVSGKDEIDKIDPRHLDSFRARYAALKFLQSHLRTPKNSNPASQVRKIAAKATQATPAQNPSNPTLAASNQSPIDNPQSEILKGLSSLPGINLNLPKITLSQAEEILGSPILNEYDYSNEDAHQSAIDTPHSEISKESAQSASFSAQICEKPLAELSEIVNRTSQIVNPDSFCQNSHQTQTTTQTPTPFRQIPNYHSRPKPNSG